MRASRVATFAALLHATWATFVYFATLGGSSHAWWPVWLLYIHWPAGILFEALSGRLSGVAYGNPNDQMYMLDDYISGALHIFGGAVWIWLVTFAIARLLGASGRVRG
jgi:hypothetical protein